MGHVTAKHVYENVRNAIENSIYSYGQPIPSERVLAEAFYVSRTTVRKAVDLLVEQGLLFRIQGKGTYVSLPRLNASNSITSTRKYLEENGLVPSTRVFFSGTRKAEHKFGRIFQIPEEAPVFQLYRLRLGDAIPYSIEYTYLPFERVPNIQNYDFSRDSLYQCFADNQIQISYTYQTLDLVTVSKPQSVLLGIEDGSSAFMRKNTIYDKDNCAVEHTLSYSVAEKYVFEIY